MLGLLFSLKTHRAVFNPYDEEEEETHHWSVRRAAIYIAISAVAVGLMSEILVGSISEASEEIGLSSSSSACSSSRSWETRPSTGWPCW